MIQKAFKMSYKKSSQKKNHKSQKKKKNHKKIPLESQKSEWNEIKTGLRLELG